MNSRAFGESAKHTMVFLIMDRFEGVMPGKRGMAAKYFMQYSVFHEDVSQFLAIARYSRNSFIDSDEFLDSPDSALSFLKSPLIVL